MMNTSAELGREMHPGLFIRTAVDLRKPWRVIIRPTSSCRATLTTAASPTVNVNTCRPTDTPPAGQIQTEVAAAPAVAANMES